MSYNPETFSFISVTNWTSYSIMYHTSIYTLIYFVSLCIYFFYTSHSCIILSFVIGRNNPSVSLSNYLTFTTSANNIFTWDDRLIFLSIHSWNICYYYLFRQKGYLLPLILFLPADESYYFVQLSAFLAYLLSHSTFFSAHFS